LVYAGKVAYKYKGIMPASTSITILSDTKGIAGGAFYNCSNLTNILIPSSVTNIESGAFIGCTGLTNITIPSNVASIASEAFSDCMNLSNIIIDSSTIASGFTNTTDYGSLLNNFTTGSELYILDSIETIGSYVTDLANFNAPVVVEIDGVNYKKFVKV